jgi:hypothetical protein
MKENGWAIEELAAGYGTSSRLRRRRRFRDASSVAEIGPTSRRRALGDGGAVGPSAGGSAPENWVVCCLAAVMVTTDGGGGGCSECNDGGGGGRGDGDSQQR